MNRNGHRALDPATARRKIGAAKSNKAFMTALLDRDQLGHREAVTQWTRLHEAAFPDPATSTLDAKMRLADESGTETANGSSRKGRSRRERIDHSEGPPGVRLAQATQDAGDRRELGNSVVGQGDTELPIVNMEADRIQVLLDDAPARFEIKSNRDADPDYGEWRSLHSLGWIAVRRHEAIIEREAEAQGVNADLVRAIMYVENAQSLDSQFAEATGLGDSESLLPMNIRPDPWAAIEDPPADLADPATNIRIAVTLLRRISDRIDSPTPAKVASIWNFTGRENVSDFGARVERAMDEKPWQLKPQSPLDANAP